MEKTIDWSEMTPACYSIMNGEDVDRGVAADMLFQNIREGKGLYRGSRGPKPQLTPDYRALKELWDGWGDEERGAANAAFNAWLGHMRAHVPELAELWRSRRYYGMIDLMGQA